MRTCSTGEISFGKKQRSESEVGVHSHRSLKSKQEVLDHFDATIMKGSVRAAQLAAQNTYQRPSHAAQNMYQPPSHDDCYNIVKKFWGVDHNMKLLIGEQLMNPSVAQCL